MLFTILLLVVEAVALLAVVLVVVVEEGGTVGPLEFVIDGITVFHKPEDRGW